MLRFLVLKISWRMTGTVLIKGMGKGEGAKADAMQLIIKLPLGKQNIMVVYVVSYLIAGPCGLELAREEGVTVFSKNVCHSSVHFMTGDIEDIRQRFCDPHQILWRIDFTQLAPLTALKAECANRASLNARIVTSNTCRIFLSIIF